MVSRWWYKCVINSTVMMLVMKTRKHVLIFHWHSLLSSDDTTVYLFSYGQCNAPLITFCETINLPYFCCSSENGAYDPRIQTRPRFCTVHLSAWFHHPIFNRTEIALTNEEILSETSTTFHYTIPVEKQSTKQLDVGLVRHFIMPSKCAFGMQLPFVVLKLNSHISECC